MAPQIIIKDPNLITKVVSIVTKVPTLTRIVILKGLVQGEIPFKIFLRVDHIKIINREPKKIGNIFQKKMIYKSWSLMLISIGCICLFMSNFLKNSLTVSISRSKDDSKEAKKAKVSNSNGSQDSEAPSFNDQKSIIHVM